jgi:hypothetical protein
MLPQFGYPAGQTCPGHAGLTRVGGITELPNKGMKQTSVEHIGRSQLIPGVGQTQSGGREHHR